MTNRANGLQSRFSVYSDFGVEAFASVESAYRAAELHRLTGGLSKIVSNGQEAITELNEHLQLGLVLPFSRH
jgi:hypothetical protein